jgi:dihydrodipicolinate synthase/N-acetylneuraminate lyase
VAPGCRSSTPFRAGELDLEALAELVEKLLPTGVAGLLTLGTTGEAAHCDDAESEAVVRAVVRAVRGRVPVLAGSGRPSTHHTIEVSRRLAAAGAQGLLVLTPHAYRARMNRDAFEPHYAAVAAAVGVPVFVYHMPGATGARARIRDARIAAANPEHLGLQDSSTTGGPLGTTLQRFATARGFVGAGARVVDAMQGGACGAILGHRQRDSGSVCALGGALRGRPLGRRPAPSGAGAHRGRDGG